MHWTQQQNPIASNINRNVWKIVEEQKRTERAPNNNNNKKLSKVNSDKSIRLKLTNPLNTTYYLYFFLFYSWLFIGESLFFIGPVVVVYRIVFQLISCKMLFSTFPLFLFISAGFLYTITYITYRSIGLVDCWLCVCARKMKYGATSNSNKIRSKYGAIAYYTRAVESKSNGRTEI